MSVDLPVSGCSLVVHSIPGMSVVTLDGHPAGITPLVISEIPPGPHTLAIFREDYAGYRADIVISAGETREISAVLQPIAPGRSTRAGILPPAISPGRGAPLSLIPYGAVTVGIRAPGQGRYPCWAGPAAEPYPG